MISKADVQLVGRCTNQLPRGDDISSAEVTSSQIKNYKQELGYEKSEYSSLTNLFEVYRDKEICNVCSQNQSNCTCASPDYESGIYQINISRLVEEWTKSVRDSQSVFVKFDIANKGSEPWVIDAKTNKSESVKFMLFFTEKRLHDHNFDPYEFSFPVGFGSSSYPFKTDYVYSWGEFLEKDFTREFRTDLSSLQEPITMPFYDYESSIVSRYKDDILESLEDFFSERGYQWSSEVENEIPAAGNLIDISKVDMVARKNDGGPTILICHCKHKSDKWHMHRFQKGEMMSVSESKITRDVKKGVRSRASKFKDIQDKMRTIGRASKVILSLLVLINISPIIETIANQGVSIQQYQELITSGQAIVMVIASVLLLIIVIVPYARDYLFEWNITERDISDEGLVSSYIF